jgi:hypothetical protein
MKVQQELMRHANVQDDDERLRLTTAIDANEAGPGDPRRPAEPETVEAENSNALRRSSDAHQSIDAHPHAGAYSKRSHRRRNSVVRTELNERDAFRAVFSFRQTLDELKPSEVANLERAKINVFEF